MEIDITGVSVMLAVPVNRDLPWQTAKSLIETVIQLEKAKIDFDIQFLVGSSIVEVARSRVADTFLKSGKSKLFMVDSDQSWEAKDALRMLALSTKMEALCAAYPAKTDPCTFLINPEEGEVQSNEYGCIPVKGLGLGFTIVDRVIMEQLAKIAPKLRFPDLEHEIAHIFRCDAVDGDFVGEDMAFFSDIRALGYTIWMDPSLTLGHVGAKEYKGCIRESLVKA